jgi:hypothetical protein
VRTKFITVQEVDIDGLLAITASLRAARKRQRCQKTQAAELICSVISTPVRRPDRPLPYCAALATPLIAMLHQPPVAVQPLGCWRRPRTDCSVFRTLPAKSLTASPRAFLADEVRKTISRSVIHRQLLPPRTTARVDPGAGEPRAPVWLVEMRRRFNLDVALFDEELLSRGCQQLKIVKAGASSAGGILEKAQGRTVCCGCPVGGRRRHQFWSGTPPAQHALVEKLAGVIPGAAAYRHPEQSCMTAFDFARLRLWVLTLIASMTWKAAFAPKAPTMKLIAEAVQGSVRQRPPVRRRAPDHPQFRNDGEVLLAPRRRR